MPTPSALFLGLFLGALGLGYFTYGRKQQALVPLLVGLALMGLPWFVTSVPVLLALAAGLVALAYLVRR